MEIHTDRILEALPKATNHTQLLLESFHRWVSPSKTSNFIISNSQCLSSAQLSNVKPRNEAMCKKCLTQWSSGQFTVNLQPSNHRRKKRRQHQIDKLQKALKETDKKSEVVKLKRQIEHLQKQNNHVAVIYSNLIPLQVVGKKTYFSLSQMYNCEICKTTTSVQCWKPKKVNKQDNHESSVTSGVRRKEEEQPPNKPKKNKGKKKKTAGLTIPPLKKTQQSLSMSKLSNMLQSSSKSQTMSKLNQFLKWLHNAISHAPKALKCQLWNKPRNYL